MNTFFRLLRKIAGTKNSDVKDAQVVWEMIRRANDLIKSVCSSRTVDFVFDDDITQPVDPGKTLLELATQQKNEPLVRWIQSIIDQIPKLGGAPLMSTPRALQALSKPPSTDFVENCFSELLLKGLENLSQNEFIDFYKILESKLQKTQENNEGDFFKFSELTTRYQIDLPNEWYLDIDYLNSRGENLLTRALEKNKQEVVRFLLKQQADPNFPLPNGGTPFLVGVKAGHLENVRDLVAARAVFSTVNGAAGRHALIIAALEPNVSPPLVKYLASLPGYPVDQVDGVGFSALGHATTRGETTTVKALLDAEVKYDERKWEYLTVCDSLEVFKYLLESHVITLQEFKEYSIVYWAVKNNALKILNYLKEHFSDQINFRALEYFRNTILHLSAGGSTAVFRFCLAQGVSFSQENNDSDTVYTQLVGVLYNHFYTEIPKLNHMKLLRQSYPDCFPNSEDVIPNPKSSSDKLILLARDYMALDKRFAELSEQLVWLYLAETPENKLIGSDDAKAQLIPLRHYISGALIKLIEEIGESDKKLAVIRNAITNMDTLSLGEALDRHDILPRQGVKRTLTYDTTKKLLLDIAKSIRPQAETERSASDQFLHFIALIGNT